jgi:hypothetical protein
LDTDSPRSFDGFLVVMTADFFPSLGRGSGAFCILPGSRARLLVVTTADLWSSLAGAACCGRDTWTMMWLGEYAHNDVPPDGRVRRQFNTFYLGAPDQALVWQIAERYIELIR